LSSIMHGQIILELAEATKYSYLFVLTTLLARSNTITTDQLISHITNTGAAAALMIIVPFALGLGSPTYLEGAYVNKGIFTAQTVRGLAPSLFSTISLNQFQQHKSNAHLTKSVLILLSMIILGTRYSLISALFIPLCFLLGLRIKSLALLLIALIVFSSAIYT